MSRSALLYLNVLAIATCGLVYELLAGTVASYLLGDSVRQFSLVIGLYLSAMGLGAWLSRYVDNLARAFVDVELGVAIVGGCSAPTLFLAFGHVQYFEPLLYAFVVWIGTLVGLELPLLMRILQSQLEFKDLVSRVLTFDYAGALLASLAFPLLLVPGLGIVRTSLGFGLINALVALWGTWLLRDLLSVSAARALRWRACGVLVVLAVAVAYADRLTQMAEEAQYPSRVVHAESSAYQRIVVTRDASGIQLYLNGNLQFAQADEYRYHEALVHPAMAVAATTLQRPAQRVLILGGGDGLALREVLKHPSVQQVLLVDLDAAITTLAARLPPMRALNRHAFDDPRVRVLHVDAFLYLGESRERWDVALVDFPDPNNFALGKLYTRHFYSLLRAHLEPQGVATIQSTSPLLSRASYWCIVNTAEAAGLEVAPYQVTVPSFGVWGFMLASPSRFQVPSRISDVSLRFLDDGMLASMFEFPRDMARVPTEINRLDNQWLVRTYETELRQLE